MADGVICTAEEQALSSIVCLSRGQSIGLTLAAEAGCLSMIAVIVIFLLMSLKVHRGVKLIERPTDLYMLSLFVSDLIQALGAVMDIKWVNEGKVYTGVYCTAQGVAQKLGEPGVAIATLIIAIHTFVGKLKHRLLIAYIVVGCSWLFVILSTAISVFIHTGKSKYYDTPTPYWCWIGAAYNAERIGGEYLWFWLTLFVSVLLYVPLFFWARGVSVDPKHWWKIRVHKQSDMLSIDTDGWKQRSLGMIAYPLVYIVVVLPLSIVRWASGFGSSTRHMSDVATFTTITIYSLSGIINVVLFLSTRSDRLTGNKRNGLEMAPGTALVVKKSKPLSTNDVECGSLRLESYTSEPAPPDELILKSSEPVSHGAFSDIWRGSLDNCLVAVKYIRVARSDEQKLQARLSIYVEAIQQLEHPNVLPVIGLSRDPDRGLGMVSPWMEHGNVIKYLKTSPNANRLQLISDLTKGLAYLHNKNIVHGDLSPANFLIDANGSPCLSSFGRSSIVESLFEAPFDRAPSYRYMAPELLLVGSQVTPASDIYSFAMCCYEILSGHSPFNNIPSEVDVIFAIYNREHPSRPPIFDPATSRGLDDRMWALMMECWNANPDNRPTANALCYSLPTMHAMACSPTTDVDDKESEGRHMSRL